LFRCYLECHTKSDRLCEARTEEISAVNRRVVGSAETARNFGTSDYPLGLIVDHVGVIRFIGELASAAFNIGYMEKLIAKTAGVHFKTPENPPKAK
jgi:hypothetical protein